MPSMNTKEPDEAGAVSDIFPMCPDKRIGDNAYPFSFNLDRGASHPNMISGGLFHFARQATLIPGLTF